MEISAVCLRSSTNSKAVQERGIKKGRDTIHRKEGWFRLYNKVFEMDLSLYSIAVYTYLCRKARKNIARASIREMAKVLKLKHFRIYEALEELEEKGMIKKEQVKAGNRILYNQYIITEIDEWKFPPKGGSDRTNVLIEHPRSNRTPVLIEHKFAHGNEEIPENQAQEEHEELYRTTNNRTTKNKDYYTSPYIEEENLSGGGEQEKEFFSENRKGKDIEGSKRIKRKKDLKGSAAGERSESPEKILEKLKEKWKGLLEGQTFKRLSIPQVLFFLENSALSPEETLAIIKKDDENPRIENPIGTLYTSLPLKSLNYRWLLKYEEKVGESEHSDIPEWKERFRRKIELLKRMGIRINRLPEPKTEEEAESILQKIRLKLYQKLWEKMREEERKRAEEQVRGVGDEELRKELLISGILRQRGIPDVFSLYVN